MPKITNPKQATLARLKAQLRTLWGKGEAVEAGLISALEKRLEVAWRCGQVLVQMRQHVRPGEWAIFLEMNFPRISQDHAGRCMAIAIANPDAKSVKDLKPDSVRLFRHGYVPPKERPQLPGDQHFSHAVTHLTFYNGFNKFRRQVELGQGVLDEEEARRDLRPMYDWLRGLYGEAEVTGKGKA